MISDWILGPAKSRCPPARPGRFHSVAGDSLGGEMVKRRIVSDSDLISRDPLEAFFRTEKELLQELESIAQELESIARRLDALASHESFPSEKSRELRQAWCDCGKRSSGPSRTPNTLSSCCFQAGPHRTPRSRVQTSVTLRL